MAVGRGVRTSLKVYIGNAKGLRAADFSLMGGKSDPYCLCEISGRPQKKVKTETIKKTLDPVWDFEGIIEGCAPGDSLEFTVFDYDAIGSDDSLGKAVLEYHKFHGTLFAGTLTLTEAGNLKEPPTLDIRVEELPLPFSVDRPNRAFVKIISAENLRAADFGGKSDPYCICEIAGKANSRFQTKVLFRNLNPVWNEEDELYNYEVGDDITFTVYDYDAIGADDEIGTAVLSSSQFHPQGFAGGISLNHKGSLKVEIDIVVPKVVKTKVDPGTHVGSGDRQPVPYQLRCIETNRRHRLAAYTKIGRSEQMLDQKLDLVLDKPGIVDISRVHATIKAWRLSSDPSSWQARIYCDQGGGGAGAGPGGGHTGGGTVVDNVPVDNEVGTSIEPGSVLRFGINEMWVVERASLQQRSQLAEMSNRKAVHNAQEDPTTIRELKVPSFAVASYLKHCPDWLSLVSVVLETRNEPDEVPCVDCIEVRDECGKVVSRHEAASWEQQQAFDVQQIIHEVRLHTVLRLRLSSDPKLMAPILRHLDEQRRRLAEIYESRAEHLD